MARPYTIAIVNSETGIVLATILSSKSIIKVAAKFLANTLNKEHHVEAWYYMGDAQFEKYLGKINHKGKTSWFK